MVSVSRSIYVTLCRCGLPLLSAAALLGTIATPLSPANAQATAQPATPQPLSMFADHTEANAVTGVVTSRGNVQIFYPARQLQATSAQAQYYSRENRIVLSGDVYILQQGNSLRGENVTYLVDEGRFVATPVAGGQVQSIYIVSDPNAPTGSAAAAPAEPFNPKPEFKAPISPP